MAKMRSKSKFYQQVDKSDSQGGVGFNPIDASNMVKALYLEENVLNTSGKGLLLQGGIVEATFDEAQIMRILKSKGVKGIRVYLALSDSFVLVGINEHGQDNVLEFDSGKKFLVNCECGGNCELCPPQSTSGNGSAVQMIIDKKPLPITDLRLLEF
jgi:hypothetical protein